MSDLHNSCQSLHPTAMAGGERLRCYHSVGHKGMHGNGATTWWGGTVETEDMLRGQLAAEREAHAATRGTLDQAMAALKDAKLAGGTANERARVAEAERDEAVQTQLRLVSDLDGANAAYAMGVGENRELEATVSRLRVELAEANAIIDAGMKNDQTSELTYDEWCERRDAWLAAHPAAPPAAPPAPGDAADHIPGELPCYCPKGAPCPLGCTNIFCNACAAHRAEYPPAPSAIPTDDAAKSVRRLAVARDLVSEWHHNTVNGGALSVADLSRLDDAIIGALRADDDAAKTREDLETTLALLGRCEADFRRVCSVIHEPLRNDIAAFLRPSATAAPKETP